MEWLQFLGYRYPADTHALIVHIMVQPSACLAYAVAFANTDQASSSSAVVRMTLEHPIVRLALLSTAVCLLRTVWGEPVLPCGDVFCSLFASSHMTWSVPLRTLPTGLYGTIHLATHHFVFFFLAPFLICPLFAAVAAASLLFVTAFLTGIPASWYEASIAGSIWCYTAVISVLHSRMLQEMGGFSKKRF